MRISPGVSVRQRWHEIEEAGVLEITEATPRSPDERWLPRGRFDLRGRAADSGLSEQLGQHGAEGLGLYGLPDAPAELPGDGVAGEDDADALAAHVIGEQHGVLAEVGGGGAKDTVAEANLERRDLGGADGGQGERAVPPSQIDLEADRGRRRAK